MSQLLEVVQGAGHAHWCPGCKDMHRIPETWEFDGNMERPSFSPSVKHGWLWGEKKESKVCHYFIKLGQIIFCSDCTHPMAGHTVPLPPISDRGY